MTMYEAALLLHVLTAIVWVGGAVAVQGFALRVLGRNDPHDVARFAGDAEVIGMRVFMPASVLLIIAASWMIYDGPYELGGVLWVDLSLGLYVLSFLTGMGFLGPESGRISKLIDEHGPDHGDVQRRIRRVMLVSRIELVWLVAIVVLMVLKPA